VRRLRARLGASGFGGSDKMATMINGWKQEIG